MSFGQLITKWDKNIQNFKDWQLLIDYYIHVLKTYNGLFLISKCTQFFLSSISIVGYWHLKTPLNLSVGLVVTKLLLAHCS